MIYPVGFKNLGRYLLGRMEPYVFSNVSSPPESGAEFCNTLCDGKDLTPATTLGLMGEILVETPTMHLTITTSDIRALLLRHGFQPRRFDDQPADDLIRYTDPDDSYCGCHRADYRRPPRADEGL